MISDYRHEFCEISIGSINSEEVRINFETKSEYAAVNKEKEKILSKKYYVKSMHSDYQGEQYGFSYIGNFFKKDLDQKEISLSREKSQEMTQKEDFFER